MVVVSPPVHEPIACVLIGASESRVVKRRSAAAGTEDEKDGKTTQAIKLCFNMNENSEA
jgi:hypothetical protein